MVNHGLSTGMLFVMVGTLVTRGGSRLIRDYGGVSKIAPLLAGLFLLAGLSSLALPGTNSFVSEFLVLVGSYPREPVFTILAHVRHHLRRALRPVGLPADDAGPAARRRRARRARARRAAPARWSIRPSPRGSPAPGSPTSPGARSRCSPRSSSLILVLGFFPGPVLDVINPSVVSTMNEVGLPDPVGGLVK